MVTRGDTHPWVGPRELDGTGAVVYYLEFLIQSLDDLSPGASFWDPTMSISHSSTSEGFVDDNSAYRNDFLGSLMVPVVVLILMTMLQQQAQSWERLLFSSGGKLELDKCLFYILAYWFKSNGS